MARNRDDFTANTRIRIAKRAGWLCSFPMCRRPTVGATSDGEGKIDVGIAAHICAAAPGGPRYDEKMSPEERSSAKNGRVDRIRENVMDTIIDRQLPHDGATEWPVLNRRKLDLLLAKPEQGLSYAARGVLCGMTLTLRATPQRTLYTMQRISIVGTGPVDLSASALFVSQREERINLCRSPRRQVTRQQSHAQKRHSYCRKRPGIGRAHAKQQCLHKAR